MVKNPLTNDAWIHIGGVIAIAIGFIGWYTIGLSHDPSAIQLIFLIGGLAAMGVKLGNSLALTAATTAATAISNMAVAVAQQQALDVTAAAMKVVDVAAVRQTARTAEAATAAQVVTDTATQTAHNLPPHP